MAAPVGSIPTRSRQGFKSPFLAVFGIMVPFLAVTALVDDLEGQVPTRPPQSQTPAQTDSSAIRDTIPADPFRIDPPVSPAGAMLRSLLLPGWGQNVLHRRQTGAFFVAFEGLAFAMSLKSKHQLAYLEAVMDDEDANSVELVDLKRQELQDWAVVLAFNHLVAAAEAYVSAYLWDFPANLIVRNLPGGNMAVGMNFALP